MSQMLDGKRMSIKKEDGLSSVGKETSALHTPDWAAVVKVENDVTAEEQTKPGNSANFFEIETDQTRGIKAETVDVNSVENSSTEEHILSYASTSTAAESNILIKKEEDIETGDEVRETVIESDFRPSYKEEQHSEYDGTKSTTLYDQANTSSVWGLCEEDCSVTPSTVGEDKRICELKRSRAYYYSNGFKLAHVSVVLKDLKYYPSVDIVKKRFSCAHCPAKFTCKSTFKNHLKIHTNKNQFLCTFCPKTFQRRSILKEHVTTHTGEKPFSCALCPAKFAHSSSVKTHLMIHSGEKPFSCAICPAKFNRRGTLKSHLIIHTAEKPFLCKYCPAKFRHSSTLKNHLITHTGEKPFLCTMCPAKFGLKVNLINHLTTHTGEKPFLCTLCPAKYRQKQSLKYHLTTHTNKKHISSADIFESETDQIREMNTERVDVKSTENPSAEESVRFYRGGSDAAENSLLIKKEEDIDLKDELFQDETSGIKAESNDVNSVENLSSEENELSSASTSTAAESNTLIKKEEDADTDEEVFQAIIESNYRPSTKEEQQCKYDETKSTTLYDQANASSVWGLCEEDSSAKFDQESDLKSHLTTHAGEKLYLCKLCPAKYRHRNNLKNHLTTHTGEKRFSCTICSAKFRWRSNLKSHLNIHTGEKPFLCKYCPAKYANSSTLKRHLTIHTGEKRFSCTYCPAKFNQNGHLKSHLRIHTNEKPFACTFCPAKFGYSSALKKHLTNHTGE